MTASPDALPVGEILRAVTPVEQELLRLLLLVPEEQLAVVDELGPDLLPSTVTRELYRAIVLQRAPNDQGVHPPFDRDRLLASLDEETRALAVALHAKALPEHLVREVELWTRRVAALDAGILKVARYYAIKLGGSKLMSNW